MEDSSSVELHRGGFCHSKLCKYFHKNTKAYIRYLSNEGGSQDNEFDMRYGLNTLLLSFFFMYIIFLSLNDSRKTTKILWAILWPSFYSFVSMTIPSRSSETTNSVSLGCRNLIRTKFLSWLLLFSPSLINRIMWMKWQLENTAKVKYEGNLLVSLTLLGLRFSLWLHTKHYVPNEKAVIFSGTQAWSSSGCWAGNAVAWQHRATAATV